MLSPVKRRGRAYVRRTVINHGLSGAGVEAGEKTLTDANQHGGTSFQVLQEHGVSQPRSAGLEGAPLTAQGVIPFPPTRSPAALLGSDKKSDCFLFVLEALFLLRCFLPYY